MLKHKKLFVASGTKLHELLTAKQRDEKAINKEYEIQLDGFKKNSGISVSDLNKRLYFIQSINEMNSPFMTVNS